jgi:AGCS family alanine or glycine:cation symporter
VHEASEAGFFEILDQLFADWIVEPLSALFFVDVAFWDNGAPGEIELPLLIVWLIFGALFFTARFSFVNLRAFGHAIQCVRGRFTARNAIGEISHFQALSAALSATVGLGNIAGVAFAVSRGGPGAVFWMVLAGFLGMSSKFAECTLGQRYRVVREDGHVSGGPMHYLSKGLSELGWPRLGAALSVIFSVLCIGASFGGGNMFQANQSYIQVAGVLPILAGKPGAAIFGVLLAAVVGLVIIGGIKRIGEVAAILVPGMCAIYLAAGLLVLGLHADQIGSGLATIIGSAFEPAAAAWGGMAAVIIQGFRRAAFSNEAGVGSAPIAHAAATTDEPVREGIVALLEPFIDTIVVCTMTGLVIVITGAYQQTELGGGIQLTSWAFAQVFPQFPVVLSITAVLFAFSTMISWSYYGEQSWSKLIGPESVGVYRVLFLMFVWIGSVMSASSVLDFGDLMLLGMAFPNIIGVVMLSGVVKRDLDHYLGRLKRGEIRPVS